MPCMGFAVPADPTSAVWLQSKQHRPDVYLHLRISSLCVRARVPFVLYTVCELDTLPIKDASRRIVGSQISCARRYVFRRFITRRPTQIRDTYVYVYKESDTRYVSGTFVCIHARMRWAVLGLTPNTCTYAINCVRLPPSDYKANNTDQMYIYSGELHTLPMRNACRRIFGFWLRCARRPSLRRLITKPTTRMRGLPRPKG